MAKKKPKVIAKATCVFDELTPKQQVFVKEYIIDFNATRAAIESGSPRGSAQVVGSRMLDVPKVCRAIAESLRPMMQEAELTAEKVVKQLHNFLFYDITPYISEDGTLKCAPEELPEAIRQSVIGFDGDQNFDRDGNLTHSKVKVRLVSKEAVIKPIMQYLKMVGADVNVEGDLVQQNFFQQFYQQAQLPASGPVIIDAPKPIKEISSNGNGSPTNGKAH